MLTTNANHTVCGHCGGSVKDSCCWMDGKAYHNSCYSLLIGVERGLKSVCVDKDGEITRMRATISRLREYARHKPSCWWWRGPNCDCGYDELRKELEEST